MIESGINKDMTARQQWDAFRRLVKKHGKQYGGKYVAMVDKEVVAVGRDQHALYKSVTKKLAPTKPVGIYYVPTKKDLMVLLWNTLT